ncbi:hypothetical protein D1AOALGA4SA_3609 [Olavius algarvensis Delta 1 endosymbiont]|nr:hypothetical protein D1AOALGA4SA_3609 [Olavius algarvensis Delta 1 endosymbiont]
MSSETQQRPEHQEVSCPIRPAVFLPEAAARVKLQFIYLSQIQIFILLIILASLRLCEKIISFFNGSGRIK